jgi:hypothetical protein
VPKGRETTSTSRDGVNEGHFTLIIARCELETCILSMALRQVLFLPIKGVPIYKQRQLGGVVRSICCFVDMMVGV